ncbi:hypothetical protein CSUI_002006 [Cystoisospora suis]|uniref:Transmembrane protein n=1 Tax=Cystoisospora suis TaxID=483139 RepID=A0A2C6LAJ4_9APIC|nr:hypothetical protein CSUI_002006 [Cystoisospora suis]
MVESRGAKRRYRSSYGLCSVERCCLRPVKPCLFVGAWLIWMAGVSGAYAAEASRQQATEGLNPAPSKRGETVPCAPVILSVACRQVEDEVATREPEDPAVAAQPERKVTTVGTELVEEDEEPASNRIKEYEYLKKVTPALDKVLDLTGFQDGCAVTAVSLMLYYARRGVPTLLNISKGLKALQMFTSAVAVLRFSEYLISLWKESKYRHRFWQAHRKIAFGRGKREERRRELAALHKSIKRAGVVRLSGVEPLIFVSGLGIMFWGSLFRAASLPFFFFVPFMMLGIAQNWSDRRVALEKAEQDEGLFSADSQKNLATQKASAKRGNEQMKHISNLKNRDQKPAT